MSLRIPLLAMAALLAGGTLPAQSRTQIGVTSVGNPVLLEPRTVKKGADGIITAAVRVQFLKPVKAGASEYRASRTLAMFDCAAKKVAVKENWYYSDDKGTKVANHKVVGIPGYGTTIKGSLPDVAMAHLCAAK
ncbi:MAG: hypothetical protein MUE41_01730 [Gemmatimonadaceae bacterium]|jgi:hypothetical protein|nr:hypothetical protein [Gemmatimonadaceae bacterium]